MVHNEIMSNHSRLCLRLALLFQFLLAGHLTFAQAPSSSFPVSTPPAPSTTPTATGPSINPSAENARQAQLAAANYNQQVAILFFMACYKKSPPEYPLCIMGLQALNQAQNLFAAAQQSSQTSNASTNSQNSPSGTSLPMGQASAGAFSDPVIAKGIQTLQDAGITVGSDGTVHMPDGSSQPGSTYSSPGSMAAAGLDPRPAVEAKALIAGLKAPGTSGSGGLGGVATGASGYSGNSIAMEQKTELPSRAGTKKALMAGKTVMFDGVPIGVRGDNIFEMIHECYQKKREGNHFIDLVSGSDRLPASSTGAH